jgi:TonB family protein
VRRVPSAALLAALALSRVAFAQPEPGHAEGVSPPVVRSRVEPVYPGAGKEAEVVVTVLVGADGRASEVKVTQSAGEELDRAAVEAVRQWTFEPAKRGDRPVASRVRVPVHFHAAAPLPEFAAPVVDVSPPPARTSQPPKEGKEEKDEPQTVTVFGRSHLPSRGAGDYDIKIGKLAAVPRADAGSLLRMAPGVMLTNAGGSGHPYQVFLRGFDAREGQDLEFSVDGVPVNEVGNPHGNGLADTHFVIPELVQSLRVVEGPYAPQQGNFAVAGSALYDLGVSQPGLSSRFQFGSFGTRRLLLTWRPEGCTDKTFGAGELHAADGFGRNRASQRATAMGGWEGRLGKSGSLRFLATSYVTKYQQAGVLRAVDVEAGREDFFGTYDTQQGGDAGRHSLSVSIVDKFGPVRVSQQVFGILRDFRLRQNLTGFVADPQEPWQSPHAQRGDLVDQQSRSATLGGRGAARFGWNALGRRHELELGTFARYDAVDALQQRNRAGTTIPYRRDLDLFSGLTDVALYVDANLRPLKWVTLRGGLRGDYFHYKTTNRCAVTTQQSLTTSALPDTECFSVDRQGYRSADQSTSTGSALWQPRGTLILGPWDGVSLSGSAGVGARSIDPQYVNQNLASPFATAVSWDAGATYERTLGAVDLLVKSVFFQTRVDKDQFFNETEGRSTLASGTLRTGWQGVARATGRFFDVAGSVTFVRAAFEDNGLLVPYAPPAVLRIDGALFGDLPVRFFSRKLRGTLGSGFSYVGKRPLPYGETAQDYALLDVGASLAWRFVEVGVMVTNLLDARYRLAEYNYVSDFRTQAYPTMVAARHFVAGEPRAVYGTLTITWGGGQ